MACGGGIRCWINHEMGLPDLFTLCRIGKKQSGIPVLQGYWDITSSRGPLGVKNKFHAVGSEIVRKQTQRPRKLQHRPSGNRTFYLAKTNWPFQPCRRRTAENS